jgi:ferredoxin
MIDAEIKFEREGLGGLVAVGSYLADTVKRFGVRFEKECDHTLGVHHCEIVVASGIDNLSPLTEAESEHFAAMGRRTNERLAHEAQIIKAGEIVIMTHEKKEKPRTDAPNDPLKAEFDALPLDKKIAALMRMEAVTLSETLAYVVNSPMKVVEKVGDVMAEFGMRLEQEARKATRPSPAAPKAQPAGEPSTGQKPKSSSRKASSGTAKP